MKFDISNNIKTSCFSSAKNKLLPSRTPHFVCCIRVLLELFLTIDKIINFLRPPKYEIVIIMEISFRKNL